MDTHGYTTDFSCYDNYCMWLNPQWIRYSAALGGKLKTTSKQFNYCEIGCGHGQTTAINAAANPESQFYGLDINQVHVDTMNRYKQELNITNFHPVLADILQPQDLPQMDIIVAHGVLSWVNPIVAKGMFEFIEKHLAPGGVLMISYDSLPGCSHRVQFANIVQRYIRKTGDTAEGIMQSLKHIQWLKEIDSDLFKIMPPIAQELEKAGTIQSIAHHFGNEVYHGYHFEDVNQMVTNIGAEYAGNLVAHLNHPGLSLKSSIVDDIPKDPVEREIVMQELLAIPFTSSVFVKPGEGEIVNPLDLPVINAMPRSYSKNGKETPIGKVKIDDDVAKNLFDRFESPGKFDDSEQMILTTALNDYILPSLEKVKLTCNTKEFVRNQLKNSNSSIVPFPSSVLGSGVGIPSEVACVIVAGNITDAQKFATECNKHWSDKVNKDVLPHVKAYRTHLKNLGA